MTKPILVIVFMVTILLTAGIVASMNLFEDVDALTKSKGTFTRDYGSKKVCGDKMCREYEGERDEFEKSDDTNPTQTREKDSETECDVGGKSTSGQVLVFRFNSNNYVCVSESTAKQWIGYGIAERVDQSEKEMTSTETVEEAMTSMETVEQDEEMTSTETVKEEMTSMETVEQDEEMTSMETVEQDEEMTSMETEEPEVMIKDESIEDTVPISILFVQMATSGTFVATDNGYSLTLDEVNPQIIYFSDRPDRITDHMTVEDFVNMWNMGDDSFESNPPNAAVTVLGAEESEDTIIVKLTNPVFDSEIMTLQYTAQILEDTSDGLSYFAEHVDGTLPESFGDVALFIDPTKGIFLLVVNDGIPDLHDDDEDTSKKVKEPKPDKEDKPKKVKEPTK